MPFALVKAANSALVNGVPLSETSTSGRPCVANTDLSLSMVDWDVAADTGTASSHLEWASTRTTTILPWKGPANRHVGGPKDGQAISTGALGPFAAASGVPGTWCTVSLLGSSSPSIPGHQI